MHTIKEAIIVEGTYDQIKLSGFLDAVIIKTNGFTIFKDEKKLETIKTLAKKTGIVILTDSDSAGFKIRNFVKQSINDGIVKHAYIPDICGKEKRKAEPSKEGLLVWLLTKLIISFFSVSTSNLGLETVFPCTQYTSLPFIFSQINSCAAI